LAARLDTPDLEGPRLPGPCAFPDDVRPKLEELIPVTMIESRH
jgi:hypothetical protein